VQLWLGGDRGSCVATEHDTFGGAIRGLVARLMMYLRREETRESRLGGRCTANVPAWKTLLREYY